jgi:hypothetical protein
MLSPETSFRSIDTMPSRDDGDGGDGGDCMPAIGSLPREELRVKYVGQLNP